MSGGTPPSPKKEFLLYEWKHGEEKNRLNRVHLR